MNGWREICDRRQSDAEIRDALREQYEQNLHALRLKLISELPMISAAQLQFVMRQVEALLQPAFEQDYEMVLRDLRGTAVH